MQLRMRFICGPNNSSVENRFVDSKVPRNSLKTEEKGLILLTQLDLRRLIQNEQTGLSSGTGWSGMMLGNLQIVFAFFIISSMEATLAWAADGPVGWDPIPPAPWFAILRLMRLSVLTGYM